MNIRWFIVIALGVLCISCKPYELIDSSGFNQQLQYNVAIQNPAEVMELVYPNSTLQGMYIDWKQLKSSKTYIVTVIDTISVSYPQAIRYRARMSFNGITWHIESIERSFSNRYDSAIKLWNKHVPTKQIETN